MIGLCCFIAGVAAAGYAAIQVFRGSDEQAYWNGFDDAKDGREALPPSKQALMN